MELDQPPPIVSVMMITYGHEDYIRQAIEGVLMQECNFSVELIVADDCSPDNTPAVVREILSTHPRASWIRYTRHSKNKGRIDNSLWALQQSKGKYTAICEGDDYWIDPYKLQKQFEYLEENSNSAGCFHHAYIIHRSDEDLCNIYNAYVSQYRTYDQEMALTWLGSSYATCTLMFRTSVLLNPPDWFKNNVCDEFIDILVTNYGNLDFIDEKMSVYRITGQGTWTGLSETEQLEDLLSRALILYNEGFFKARYSEFLIKKINKLSIELSFDKGLGRRKRFHYFLIAIRFIKFNRLGHFLFVLRFLIDPIYTIIFSDKSDRPSLQTIKKNK
jgi:glycosyltransferase involved in cell wall biosynthesis